MIYETKGHIAVITLNRPKAMNAINGEVTKLLEASLEKFEADPNLWYHDNFS